MPPAGVVPGEVADDDREHQQKHGNSESPTFEGLKALLKDHVHAPPFLPPHTHSDEHCCCSCWGTRRSHTQPAGVMDARGWRPRGASYRGVGAWQTILFVEFPRWK